METGPLELLSLLPSELHIDHCRAYVRLVKFVLAQIRYLACLVDLGYFERLGWDRLLRAQCQSAPAHALGEMPAEDLLEVSLDLPLPLRFIDTVLLIG